MRRGDLYWVDFDPVKGSEANKTRPAVLVSNDAANRAATRNGRGVVTVVPITSNVDRIYSFQVLLRADECGLPTDSKAQAEQLRAVAVHRLGARIGSLSPSTLAKLDAALRIHFGL
ncbi:type II toxin-antitoxin system PemK/MazF family toxin [Sphaerisporangium perillae]|uniref:type II toxin-antitoxin system PemK/MazF family toxin n=1 Tax=Sphaerisporangium perillae TaxID=2935860 RepID=UPI00200F56FB|nr:type II toxin-antitoxin system PemK/MazF family toxin [Sphaerisporangium perillae]